MLFDLIILLSFAQDRPDATKTKIDTTKPIKIEYQSKSWNKNPTETDHSALILRDSLSKKIVRIEVQETEPNSSYFSGQYQVNFQTSSEITPEIFVVPKDVLNAPNMVLQINAMLEEGTLFRKPYFLRPMGKYQTITVYDSKDEAYQAYDKYLTLQSTKAGPQVPPSMPASTLDAEMLARATEEKARLEAEAIHAAKRKMDYEAEEARKKAELIKKQTELDAQERARRQALAKEKASLAMEAYKNGDYAIASKNFDLSTQLDPSNNQYYYQYGVSLYKIGEYKKSLAILKLSSDENINLAEKKYYFALNHMKLKELDSALSDFQYVRSTQQKPIAASSAFFAGVILFQKENYNSAKENFEYVLDESDDAKLDSQAENYIEQIANILQFQEMKNKPWSYTLNAGLIYDSNILSIAASASPTDLAGWRLLYGATIDYRMIFEKDYDWTATLNASDMYSTDKNFQASATHQLADPLQITFYLPFKWRGQFFSKLGQWQISPGYESITMNADGQGAREPILDSKVIKADSTLVMRDNYYANYALETRLDHSLIRTSSVSESQTATKVTFSTSHTFFQDKAKTTAQIYEGALTMNMAEGSNQKYNRFDLAGSYLSPVNKTWTWTSKLAAYYSTYPDHSSSRADKNLGLTLGFNRMLYDKVIWNLILTYNNNMSNVSSSQYDKYTLMSTFSF